MSDEHENAKQEKSASPGFWGRLFWFLVILIISAVVVFLSFIWLGKQGIESTKEAFVEAVTAFKPEEVVETFAEWRDLEAEGNDGNILEVATAESTEKFTRKTNIEMFGRALPLGTTISEISIPATYRYHIDLNGNWSITTDGVRLLVMAPAIQASLPVAFDTAGVQKKTKSGWARWDGDDNLTELEKTISSKLEERAVDESSLEKIRGESREPVAKFIQTWLLSQGAWGDAMFEEIFVIFEGENTSFSSISPALELNPSSPETVREEEVVAP